MTHCLLSAALSLVCSQVHWLLEAMHWEHVGSTPSHLIFLRLEGGRKGEGDQMGPGNEEEEGDGWGRKRPEGMEGRGRGHSGQRRS